MAILCVFVLFPPFGEQNKHIFVSRKNCLHFYIEIMEIIDYIYWITTRTSAYNSIFFRLIHTRPAKEAFYRIIATNLHAMRSLSTHFFLSHAISCFNLSTVFLSHSIPVYYYVSFEPNEFHSN